MCFHLMFMTRRQGQWALRSQVITVLNLISNIVEFSEDSIEQGPVPGRTRLNVHVRPMSHFAQTAVLTSLLVVEENEQGVQNYTKKKNSY